MAHTLSCRKKDQSGPRLRPDPLSPEFNHFWLISGITGPVLLLFASQIYGVLCSKRWRRHIGPLKGEGGEECKKINILKKISKLKLDLKNHHTQNDMMEAPKEIFSRKKTKKFGKRWEPKMSGRPFRSATCPLTYYRYTDTVTSLINATFAAPKRVGPLN